MLKRLDSLLFPRQSPVREASGVSESARAPRTAEARRPAWQAKTTAPAPVARRAGPQALVAPGVSLPQAADAALMPLSQGATRIEDRAVFDALSRGSDVPGGAEVREMKLLITGVDGPEPQLYFMNTNTSPYHFDFYSKVLGGEQTLRQFNFDTYKDENIPGEHKNLALSVLAYDDVVLDGQQGVFALQAWPTDIIPPALIARAHAMVKQAAPALADRLRYYPASEDQEAAFIAHRDELTAAGVQSVDSDTLFKNLTFSALNPGVGFGLLRVVTGEPGEKPPSVRDVVVLQSLPNDLAHTGGVISAVPQTPLSHVNLKAKQNDTPNAYIKDAATDPRIAPLVGKVVRFEVTAGGFELREATPAEQEAYLESIRPKEITYPRRDLRVQRIRRLDELGATDRRSYGAKAANVAELRQILAPGRVPDGFAVPFYFYDRFMRENGLYDEARAMLEDPEFKADAGVREEKLKKLRKKIEKAPVPAELAADLAELQAAFPAGQPIRVRSSSNVEDGDKFSGAGLHDSKTHRPDEGALENTVKEVWASLWTFRAFEERDFHRIDHFRSAMGLLVHPNFDDELANGVAITRNLFRPEFPGFYVNVQVGESLVTNPDPAAVPDELLISRIGLNGELATQFVRRSSLSDGKPVLDPAQIAALVADMETIQQHFAMVYGREDDPDFAMDIELKIDGLGNLVIKQARPYVP